MGNCRVGCAMAPVLVAFCACGRFGFDEHGAQPEDSSVAADVAMTPGFCATAVFANPGTSYCRRSGDQANRVPVLPSKSTPVGKD